MNTKAPKIAFLLLLLILMAAFGAIIRPFLLPILFSVLIAVICEPIYQLFLKVFKWRYLASFIATVVVAICILIPLGIIAAVIVINASDAVGYVTSQLEVGQISVAIDNVNAWLTGRLSRYADFLPADFNIRATLLGILTSAGKVIYQYSPKVISATANVAGGFLLMIVFLFVFFADGGRMYRTVFGLLPLAEEHKQVLAREVRLVMTAVFLGAIATSVAQGILIGIGFWIAGISNPLVWGLVAVGVTLLPVVGGPLMYVPASIALIVGGKLGVGIFLLLYGIGIVSMVDNIVKPLVMRGKVNIHPLLLALSLIGGGLWLGPSGIIIGPLVIVLMMAMLRIYGREFI